MEAKLLDCLHHRLDELEQQIQARRRELVADFQHYYHDLLHGVPPDTVSNVRRALAASLSDYPTLRPELLEAESQLPETPRAAAFQPSAPFAVSRRADVPGSPRERENELRGLFTPTYLPLLDSTPMLSKPVLAGPLGPAAGVSESTLLPERVSSGIGQGNVASTDGMTEQGSGQRDAPDQWLPPAPPFSVPTLRNNSTHSIDDTRSSVSSDKSDSKPTRSALRRSSSITKPPQSPRRVRFEFMGAEVLPTSSPQPPEFMGPRPGSPDPNDDGSDAAFNSNLGGETIEEENVPPRKVSSSDALRALSRVPLEAGPVWTIVNAEADEVAPDQRETAIGQHDKSPPSLAALRTMPESSRTSESEPRVGHSDQNQVGTSEGDDSSDDGFLAMKKTKSSSKKPLLPPMPQSPSEPPQDSATTLTSQTSKEVSHTDKAEEDEGLANSDGEGLDDDDDMFHFEAGGLTAPPRPRSRPPPKAEEEEEETVEEAESESEEPQSKDDESSAPHADVAESQVSMYATSPAVHIQRAAGSRAASVKFQPGSLGSYKGRALMMPIVSDPEVLEQAMNFKPTKRQSGGMDDVTAMAEGSLRHLPPSIPLSFKERFSLDEMMRPSKS